jgi:hypothetical protein
MGASMNGPHDRRGFLRSLVSLPLIGGGVTLIGQPAAAAVPVTRELLESYNSFLALERRAVIIELHGRDHVYVDPNTPGAMCFWRSYGEPEIPPPSARAAVVLAAVGCRQPGSAALAAGLLSTFVRNSIRLGPALGRNPETHQHLRRARWR